MKSLKVTQDLSNGTLRTIVEYNGQKIPSVRSIKTHIFINDMGLEEIKVLEANIYNPEWFSSEKSQIINQFIDAIKDDGGRVILVDLEPTDIEETNWGSLFSICAGVTILSSMLAHSRNKKQLGRARQHTSR